MKDALLATLQLITMEKAFDKALDKELHRVRMNREGLQTLSSQGELDYHLRLSNGFLYMHHIGRHNTRWWNDLPAVIIRFSRFRHEWTDLMQSCRCAWDMKCEMELNGLQWDHGNCFVFLPASKCYIGCVCVNLLLAKFVFVLA